MPMAACGLLVRLWSWRLAGARQRGAVALATSLLLTGTVAADDGPVSRTPALSDGTYPGVIELAIDARDVDRAIVSGTLTLPVASDGPMTFYFPRWVPGHHAPSGPISRIAGLSLQADGAAIAWRRDPVDMNALHFSVPAGARQVQLSFQYLSPTDPGMGRIEITSDMADLQWTSLAPYPAGYASRNMTYRASVRLPQGWQFATALQRNEQRGDTVHFEPVDYETLVDSPIVAGRYYERVMLDDSRPAPVTLHLFADEPRLLRFETAQIESHRALVEQTYRLFRSRHFDRYDFLVGLTAKIGSLGAEHHRSSENFTVPSYFTDWANTAPSRELLPHELVHSWNGKYRRGADLLTPTLDRPMRNSLLWVYEGLTRYLGAVLAVRAGLHTRQQGLENFAVSAARMQNRAGRRWRPLADTVNHSIFLDEHPVWPSWQRGSDYYLEGQLIWLDIDTRLRELTGDRKSLDDFVRVFFAGTDGAYRPLPYDQTDVVDALNAIAPYRWEEYFRDRVEQPAPEAPLDGLIRGGYRLVYADSATDFFRNLEAQAKVTDLGYSIGLIVNDAGVVTDVIWDTPAFDAAMTIGTQVIAVDAVVYSSAVLTRAVSGCKGRTEPLRLTLRRGDAVREARLDCSMGLRYPRLERIAETPARLDAILAPR